MEGSKLALRMLPLRNKLGNPSSDDNLIAMISKNFPVVTQKVQHDTEAIVTKICNCFSDATYLTPIRFYDLNGDDFTDKMHMTPRLANACAIETKLELPLCRLGPPIPVYQRCIMKY